MQRALGPIGFIAVLIVLNILSRVFHWGFWIF